MIRHWVALTCCSFIAGRVSAQELEWIDRQAFDPAALQLEFNTLPFDSLVEVGDVYASLGLVVSGEGSSRPVSRHIPTAPQFSYDIAIRNESVTGSSANEALTLRFRFPVKRIGLTLGNGDAGTRVRLRAFGVQGNPLGELEHQGVDWRQGPFVAFQSTSLTGMATVLVDYGDAPAGEQINALRVEFSEPRVFQTCVAHIGVGTAGEVSLQTSVRIQNAFAEIARRVVVRFFTPAGFPWDLELDGTVANSLDFNLGPQAFRELRTTATAGPVQAGYAVVESDLPVSAAAIYVTQKGGQTHEAGIDSAEGRLWQLGAVKVDPLEGLSTAVAIVNLSTEENQVTLWLCNESGDTSQRSNHAEAFLEPGGHGAWFVQELFDPIYFSPVTPLSLWVSSRFPVAVTMLRTRDGIAVASLPTGSPQD